MSLTGFDPVSRRTVSAEIRQRLADAIHTGQLAPGTPLPAERVPCQEFGVARTPVREPVNGTHEIAVDTGCFATGRLSAVRLDGDARDFLWVTGR